MRYVVVPLSVNHLARRQSDTTLISKSRSGLACWRCVGLHMDTDRPRGKQRWAPDHDARCAHWIFDL